MCGVVSVVLCGTWKGDATDLIRRNAATYFFTHILKQTEERGKDATGMATMFNNGDYCGLKMAVEATKFIERFGDTTKDFDGYFKACYENEAGVAAHIGHCRKTSVGGTSNENNHPVRCGHIVGVHNGTLTNHAKIFEELGCKRDGIVDTEAIFRLMEHSTDNCKEPFSLPMLHDVARKLDGSFTTLSFNGNNPNQLAVMRSSRPLDVVLIKSLGMLILTSDDRFFKKTMWYYNTAVKLGFIGPNAVPLESKDVEYRIFPDDNVGIVDITAQATGIMDVLKFEKMTGEKIWRTPAAQTTGFRTAYQEHEGFGGGYGRQYHGAYNVNQHNTNKEPAKETKNETNTKQDTSDCIWVRGIESFVNETAESLAVTFKGNGVTLMNPVTLKQRDLTDEHTGTPSKAIVVHSTDFSDKTMFGSFSYVDDVATFDNETTTGVYSTLDVIPQPDGVTTNVIHLPPPAPKDVPNLEGIPVFSDNKDVAEYLDIPDENLSALRDLPLHVVAAYITRAIYTKAHSAGIKTGRELLEMKLTKATSATAAAKELVLVMAEHMPNGVVEEPIEKMIKSAGKENLRAYSSLFRKGDATRSEIINHLCELVKEQESGSKE